MNKVTTINLNGNAYQLEENGYETLRAYLDSAARRLEGNPDKDEIVADIERAIADKFRARLAAYKTVVVTKEVEQIIAEMGPVQDASAPQGDASSANSGDGVSGERSGTPEAGAEDRAAGSARRLYKIKDGAMVGGVCNGLAAYFDIDVSVIRILFSVLAVMWGFGVLLYFLMLILIPAANTSAEKAAAYGGPSTAEEFIRRAKEGYYEGMKSFRDKKAHREWKRKFKQDMRGWGKDFQREMHDNAHQWRENWRQQWAERPRFNPGMFIALPFLALFNLFITLLGFYAMYSLWTKGGVFGMHLPAGVPVWVGIVGLIIVCQCMTWPVRALRHTCYHHSGWSAGCVGLWDSFVCIGIIVLGVWFANRHVPQVHEALRNVLPSLHHALDSAKQAWNKQ